MRCAYLSVMAIVLCRRRSLSSCRGNLPDCASQLAKVWRRTWNHTRLRLSCCFFFSLSFWRQAASNACPVKSIAYLFKLCPAFALKDIFFRALPYFERKSPARLFPLLPQHGACLFSVTHSTPPRISTSAPVNRKISVLRRPVFKDNHAMSRKAGLLSSSAKRDLASSGRQEPFSLVLGRGHLQTIFAKRIYTIPELVFLPHD